MTCSQYPVPDKFSGSIFLKSSIGSTVLFFGGEGARNRSWPKKIKILHRSTFSSSTSICRRVREPGRGASATTRRSFPTIRCSAISRKFAAFTFLSREEEHQLAVEYKEFGNLEAAYKLVTGESASGRDDRAGVSKVLQKSSRPDSRRQHGLDGGGEKFRSLSRRAFSFLCGVVDSRLHDPLHHERLAHGQDRHDPGATKFFFNLQKEKEKIEAEGLSPAPNCWPSA